MSEDGENIDRKNSYEVAMASYEAAKKQWSTFEGNDSRFPFPRKNYKYVAAIVDAEGNGNESVARARAYFDDHPIWLVRAESYLHLADQLDEWQASELARTVYDFTIPLLEHAPQNPNSDSNNESTISEYNVLAVISQAVAKSKDEVLITQHRKYLSEEASALFMKNGDDPEEAARKADWFVERLDTYINPDKYCVEARRPTQQECQIGFMTCKVCRVFYMSDQESGSWLKVSGDCKLQDTLQYPADSPEIGKV